MKKILVIAIIIMVSMVLHADPNQTFPDGVATIQAIDGATMTSSGVKLDTNGTYQGDWTGLQEAASIWVASLMQDGAEMTVYLQYDGDLSQPEGSIRYQFVHGNDYSFNLANVTWDTNGNGSITVTWDDTDENAVILYCPSWGTSIDAVYIQGVKFTDANGVMHYVDFR